MTQWPKDNQEARNEFYGDPGKGEISSQLVTITPPFRMTFTDDNGKTTIVKNFQFHRKCADALVAALNEIWEVCGLDQAKVDASGASKFFGTYVHRYVRGSTTKWSNHAYGAAIDLNAGQNALGTIGNMPQFIVDAFVRQGAMWGGWYQQRPDWMHFEFVDNGGRKPQSQAPNWGGVNVPDVKPSIIADRRARMGKTILDFEARRDTQGHLAIYKLPTNDGGGTYEVAGINDKYHPEQASELRSLLQAGKYNEAEAKAVEYMCQYTDVVTTWSPKNAGIEFYARDCAFNRGPTGAIKIFQMALGIEADGIVGPVTRGLLAIVKTGEFLEKLRDARESYELKVAGRRENLWVGLTNRWNNSLVIAKKFAAESDPGSEITIPPPEVPVKPKDQLAPTFWGRVLDLFKKKG